MKIMVITPGVFPAEEVEIRRRYLETMASPGTELHAVALRQGPESVRNTADLQLLVPGILERAKEAEGAGFDALIIHGFDDPGVEAARTIVRIPVVGPGESTYYLACTLADKFGVITFLDNVIPHLMRTARSIGVEDRILSMRAVNIPVLELKKRREELIKRFSDLSRRAVDEGAQLIIPGCLAFLANMGREAKGRIEEEIGAPILDPQAIALRTAEMLVNLGLSHSKRAFPSS